MKPTVVVLGETYEDARTYILANRETRPVLNTAVVLSASAAPGRLAGMRIAKVIETQAARFGRNYGQIMPVLIQMAKREKPLT